MNAPDASLYRATPDYLRELLERAQLGQREAARILGLENGLFRSMCRGTMNTPYVVQYALEQLALARERSPATAGSRSAALPGS